MCGSYRCRQALSLLSSISSRPSPHLHLLDHICREPAVRADTIFGGHLVTRQPLHAKSLLFLLPLSWLGLLVHVSSRSPRVDMAWRLLSPSTCIGPPTVHALIGTMTCITRQAFQNMARSPLSAPVCYDYVMTSLPLHPSGYLSFCSHTPQPCSTP